MVVVCGVVWTWYDMCVYVRVVLLPQSRALRREKTSDDVHCSTDDGQKVSTRNYLQATYVAFMNMDDDESQRLEAKRQSEYDKQAQANAELIQTLISVSALLLIKFEIECRI